MSMKVTGMIPLANRNTYVYVCAQTCVNYRFDLAY